MRTVACAADSRERLLPNPYASEEDLRRLRHEDLADRSTAELWAEERYLEHELAKRLYHRRRPRMMAGGELTDNPLLTDHEWLKFLPDNDF